MSTRRVTFLCLWAAGSVLGSAQAASDATPPQPLGPLRVCATNPRYFADPSGRPVYLTGSHTWQSLQDGVLSNVNGDPNGDGWGIEIHTLQVPGVLEVQKAYVRKVVETVNDLDNILYEICNEGLRHSRDWQYAMVRFVKDVEAELPKQHPVGMTFSAAPGRFRVEWIHAAEGINRLAGEVAGGSQRSFTAPFSGDAVLYRRQRQAEEPTR